MDSPADEGAYGVFNADMDGDNDLLSANRDADEVVVNTQTRTHEAYFPRIRNSTYFDF